MEFNFYACRCLLNGGLMDFSFYACRCLLNGGLLNGV